MQSEFHLLVRPAGLGAVRSQRHCLAGPRNSEPSPGVAPLLSLFHVALRTLLSISIIADEETEIQRG